MEQDNVKDRITNEAALLFGKNGLRAVTMDDIARHAGISKRTLYEHFENKDALLMATVELHGRKSELTQQEIEREAKNPIDFMHRHFRIAVSMIQNTHPGLFIEFKKFHPTVYNKMVKPMQQEAVSVSSAKIKQGIEQGYFREGIPVELASKLLHAQIDLIYDNELFPSERFTRVDLFQHIIITFLRGCATEKGLKEIELLFTK
jgi:TetR/AcrR family transcriptional regulator, cholesterol catabolism regulator